MRVLGLVPARGGSKGVPGKNIRLLGGRPLLAWTAEAALASRLLSRVVLTTDDEAIAAAGREAGLDVPFMRPADLAGDAAAMIPVVRHAVSVLEAMGDSFDAICLLQPTTPFRTADDIDRCVSLLIERGADTVLSVLPVPAEHHPAWVYVGTLAAGLRLSTGEPQPIARRQELPPAWHRDGAVYVTRRAVLDGGTLYGGTVLGVEMDPSRAVNIDEPEDWALAEAVASRVSLAPARPRDGLS